MLFCTSRATVHYETDLRTNMTNETTNASKAEVARMIAESWGGLPQDKEQTLCDSLNIHTYKKGEKIYHDNELPTHMMFVISGKAKIYKDCDGDTERRQLLRIIKPNEFFAYRAFFANERYKTTSIALDTTTIAQIPLELVRQLSVSDSNVSAFLIRQLAGILGRSDERIVNLTQKPIRGRLAETLLKLKNEYGSESICLRMSRADLACLSNMTTSNAIRTLSAFACERLIAINGKNITIINEPELSNISKLG